MFLLFAFFLLSLLGMLFIPLRHLAVIRYTDIENTAGNETSSVRSGIVRGLDTVEKWYRTTVTDFLLKIVDSILKFVERTAGRVAGYIKNTRVDVQERFRVIPRESTYWKQIQTWKRTTVVAKQVVARDTDHDNQDVSNHSVL